MSEFDKVIGYEDIKTELKRFCDVLMNPEKYEKVGVKAPAGILLHGDPGLGKTLMAQCFIKESGRKTFTIRQADHLCFRKICRYYHLGCKDCS